MVFLIRALTVAVGLALSFTAGCSVQRAVSTAYLSEAEGTIRLIVGLEGTLLALVLGFLISICHGLFTAQQNQWQTIGRAIITLDRALIALGPKGEEARTELPRFLNAIRARFWRRKSRGHKYVDYDELALDDDTMRRMFSSVRPSDVDEKRHLSVAQEMFTLIFETQLTMAHGLVNQVPLLLFNSVVGWSCVLFFGYGLLSTVNLISVAMAALGAASIASAAFLIMELSDPYVGMFRMPTSGVDKLLQLLAGR